MTTPDVEFIEHVFAELTDQELKARESGDVECGSLQNRVRIKRVAEYCAQRWPGDLVEIGLLHGNTTKILAEVARQHGRRVIGIDPFELPHPGASYGKDYYQVFLRNIEPWREIIDVIKLSSLDPKTIAAIRARELCFAYVDGLHTYDACLSDIKATAHCRGIIAVDDIHVRYGFAKRLLRAFHEGAAMLSRVPLDCMLSREGYLVPQG